jgi:hypothetical protein
VNLYQYWQYSEFNVFGLGSGSEANFNSGTSITVVNSLKDQSGNIIVPTCVSGGYAGETNNLNLGSCSSNSNGQIVFIESNGYAVTFDTNPTSFVGSAGTITFSGTTYSNGQSGSYASSSYSATANVPTNYQFLWWEYSGSSGSGVYVPNISTNPTTVQVSGTGWLKAVYTAQVTFYTNPSTVGSISWGSCSNPGNTNGQTIYDGNLPPEFTNTITVCANVPSGYAFSGWSTTGGLSVASSSASSTTATFTGPGSITATFAAVFTYSLSNSGGITVTQGGSGLNTITATLQTGTSQSVSLSCTGGLPSGASCSFNPASGSPTFSSTLTISTTSSTPTGSYTITVNGNPAATAGTSFTLTVNTVPSGGKTIANGDLVVWRPSSGTWFIRHQDGSSWQQQWGTNGDTPLVDANGDLIVWRPSNGVWFILKSSSGYTSWSIYQWGTNGDTPLVDANGDLIVWRPSNGVWFILNLPSYTSWDIYQWGTNGDTALVVN